MLVVCFVLRSERRSFIATGLNTYIYLQSTTLVFFLPQLFASGWESSQGCSHPKARSVYLLVFIQKSWNKATKVRRSFNAQTSCLIRSLKILCTGRICKTKYYTARSSLSEKIFRKMFIFSWHILLNLSSASGSNSEMKKNYLRLKKVFDGGFDIRGDILRLNERFSEFYPVL